MEVQGIPEKYTDKGLFPSGATFHHRDELDSVQRELREIPGVTVLIYDQTCAAEKRRMRKRGTYPDPAKRMFINDAVCEGCGDCSVQSNCLSIYPLKISATILPMSGMMPIPWSDRLPVLGSLKVCRKSFGMKK